MLTSFKTTVKVAASGLLLSAAMATSVASASEYQLTDDQKRAIAALLTAPKTAPGVGIGIPSGFGIGRGQVFASIGGITTKDSSGENDYDGSATLGFGLGNADDFVALEIQANIISLTDNAPDSDFGEEGSASVKLSRNVGKSSAIAVGVEDLTTWGDTPAIESVSPSGYISFTTLHALSSNPKNPLIFGLTVGVGSERFQDLDTGVRDNGIGLFGSLSLAVHRQIGLIVEHNGIYANVGVSFIPLRSYPLAVTLSAVNVDEVARTDGGTATGETEFGGSIGYSWYF